MGRKDTRTPQQRRADRKRLSEILQQAGLQCSSVEDVQELFKDMVAMTLEGGLEGEFDGELGCTKYDYRNKNTDNSRNGHTEKTLKSSLGEMGVSVPRDRKGEFEPQLVKKNQTTLGGDIEGKILSMYAKGMSTADIEAHIRDIYGISVSDSTISRVTDKILPIVREWQQRPLESVYAVVFMDAVHFHVRSEGQIVKKAVYIALGVAMDGRRDVLGMWVEENESAKFWLGILNSLKNRGVEDILITCVDGLTGFPQAIEAIYPKAEIQQCIIHQIRSSTRYVSYKDVKAFTAALKPIYKAPTEEIALEALGDLEHLWGAKYPAAIRSWREHWDELATMFKYARDIHPCR